MSGLDSLVAAAGRALDPLRVALDDPDELGRLLADIGWEATIDEDALALVQSLLPLADSLADLPATLAALEGSLLERAEAIADLVALTADVMATIGRLADLQASDVAALPRPLGVAETWSDIAVALPDHLLAAELERTAPAVFSVLRLLGLVGAQRTPFGARHRFRWDQLGTIVGDPLGALASQAGWGGRLRTWPLLRELGAACARTGAATRFRPLQDDVAAILAAATGSTPSGFECDVVLFRGRVESGAAAQLGLVLAAASESGGALYIGNLVHGEVAVGIALAEPWQIVATGEVDGTATVGALLRPAGLEVVTSAAEFELSLALVGAPSEPWTVVGGAVGPRIELAGVRFEVGLTGSTGEPDAYVALRIDDGDLRVVLDLGGADGFLRSVVGKGPTIALGGELRASTSAGLQVSGGVGLEVTIPIDEDLGPLHVDSVSLALGAAETGARLSATAALGFTVGPFSAQAAGLGLGLDLIAGSTGLGGIDTSLAFVPPTRIGLEVDLAEVVTGGGFVDHDPELGRYTGALALEFPAVGLGAVVVVDTQLPGDPDGWALFASIFATFSSLPLGFGFFLSGVGGLVCINRTMDAEAIAGGLKSGAVDAILFPDDPVEDSKLIISQLDAWFPLAEGSAVFGIAATITWGTPKAIVTGQLGVVVSFPDLDIAVLGSVFMALPTEEEALIELHMDTIGVIDMSEQTVMVAASLYDSSLLRTIHLSGDMAMYTRLGADPYFLLSIGGYNPHFQPPAGLPAFVLNLTRMRAEVAISEDIWYALEAYVAVTSNTLQFGAQASIEASAKFLTTTYTARGEVGFDVLLVFSPFAFIVDFHAGVSVTAGDGDRELLAVSLAAHLEGPKPWYATGHASFDFFGIGVKFELEFGGAAGAEAPARENVLDLVLAALREASAWRGVLPAGADAAVVVFGTTPEVEGEVWVRPDAELEAVQSLAPLARPLDRYGLYAIDGPTTLEVTGVALEGGVKTTASETVFDWFAAAQYDDMTRTEKLSAPSYEQMAAGVRFGTAVVSFGEAEATTVVPDYEVRVLDEERTRKLPVHPLAGTLAQALVSLALEPMRRGTARTVTSTSFTVGTATWQTADATTGAAVGAAGTYRDALTDLRAAIAVDPSVRASLRLAPSHALVGSV